LDRICAVHQTIGGPTRGHRHLGHVP
jgi:hypothetical protein